MPIEILMPALSPTMEEGTLSKWLVKEGDQVNSGDLLAEIETDKATMEIEAVEEGTIVKLLFPEGSTNVKVNRPIAILLEDGEDISSLNNYKDSTNQAPNSKSVEKTMEATINEIDTQKEKASRKLEKIKSSPLARRLAKNLNVDLSQISGSGPNGRVIKIDIEAYIKDLESNIIPSQTNQQVFSDNSASKEIGALRYGGAEHLTKLGIEPGSYDLVPLNNIQKVISKRLLDSSQNVPSFPLTIDCEIDELLRLRKELNQQAGEFVKISVNDMLIRASALSLKHCPEANASYTPDGIAIHKHADIAVAVSIESGLITPIIRQADNKGLSQISTEMKDLASRARERKLKPTEYQGGTFSISNLGMMGIKEFGSIINEPHGMILSVGEGNQRPIVREGALDLATIMTVTLTCDHRVIDGALGAKWLQHFKRYIEKPITMML
jgi:pyruvate dehydrogenase E2 component (dihydrolipoamide acetyltransferase)